MSIFQYWKTYFCLAFLRLNISSSKAATSSETTNIDQRMAQESGAVGASASGGSKVQLTLNQLDGGAIKQAFGMGEHALNKVTSIATGSQSAAHHTAELALNGALSSIEGTQKAFDASRQEIAKAYEDSKIGARGALNTTAIMMGGAVVLVVAVMALKKGG